MIVFKSRNYPFCYAAQEDIFIVKVRLVSNHNIPTILAGKLCARTIFPREDDYFYDGLDKIWTKLGKSSSPAHPRSLFNGHGTGVLGSYSHIILD